MSNIRIEHAKKIYDGNIEVISDLSLDIADGSLFTLLGPSGCGKTTLLRMIAGFNTIEGGRFFFGDTLINDREPSKRNIGMVFQNYAIFPHMSVRGNVEFGLRQRKVPKAELASRAEKCLNLMQLEEFAARKPDQLSGGQQQRVALARALVIKPDVLLMDEPLSNLDAKLRLEMRQIIRHVQNRVGITTVYVTHDQEEAMAISDRIAVMNQGEIQQVGAPKELYHRPVNVFVATFIGRTNLIDAELRHAAGGAELVFSDDFRQRAPAFDDVADQPVKVSVRPEDFVRTEDGPIEAKIADSVYLGRDTDYFMDTSFSSTLQMSEKSKFAENLALGEQVRLRLNIDKINVFTRDGARNLLQGDNRG